MTRRRTQSTPPPASEEPVASSVEKLTEHVKIVWQALDEIRDDLQWALRNADDIPGLTRPMRITSMALDPCDPEWGKKLNALRPEDVPPAERERDRDASLIVDGPQFEHAMDRLAAPGPDGQRAERIEVTAEAFAEAMEGVDQLVYCCTEPELAWEGDPDAPSVVCRKCGYVVAEYGSVVDDRITPKQNATQSGATESSPTGPVQGRLWE